METKFIEWSEIEFKGKKGNTIKTTCPLCSSTRKNPKDPCLYVNMNDGVAKCYNCDSLGFRDSLSNRQSDIAIKYDLPPQNWHNFTNLSDTIVQYFETRKISQKTLECFGITQEKVYQPQRGKEIVSIAFNYFEGDVLVNKKFRSLQKEFTQSKNGKPIFYNINSIIGADEAYIQEGELDVLSLYEIGIKNAISLPNGANDNDAFWVNSEKYLKDIKKFYIATDMDEKGEIVAEKIAQRLGRYRCERVLFEGKDANEDLQNMVLQRTIHRTKKYPAEGTLTMDDIYDELIDLYNDGIPKVNKPKGREFTEINEMFSTMKGQLTVVTGIPSSGKALDVNTKIFTPKGFTTIGEINVGDELFDENGNICRVKAKSEVFENRPTYKLGFSDGSFLIADENHEWLTSTRKSRLSEYRYQKRFKKNGGILQPKGTDQSYKREYDSIKTTKEIVETLLIDNGTRKNHAIKVAKPLNLNHKELLVNPYVLGVWLGDGTSKSSQITTGDKEVMDNIANLGHEVVSQNVKYHYNVKGLIKELRKINVYDNKHIPVEYLTASYEQRLELLRGLMDSDGYAGKDGENEFCSVRKQLADDVYTLICSLGIKCNYITNDAKIYGRYISERYRISFKTHIKIYNLKRKQETLDNFFYGGGGDRANDVRHIKSAELVYGYKTQCIEVDSPSHLFLAGESMIPTHNSNITEWYLLNLAKDYNYKLSFFTPEHTPYSMFHSKMAEKVIGKPFFNRRRYDNGVERMNKEDLDLYKAWANERVYLTDSTKGEVVDWDWLLKTFEAQMLRYGINIFIVDAFNKVIMRDKDEKKGIRDMLTKLTQFCSKFNVEIFLIAHPTKMRKLENGQYEIPTLYDVSGSADFRNQTHNGYTIHREYGNNGNDRTLFVCGKVKFQFQGEIGKSCSLIYDTMNGRYYREGDQPNRMSFFDTNYDRINNQPVEVEINDIEELNNYANPFAGMKSQSQSFDFSSFEENQPF